MTCLNDPKKLNKEGHWKALKEKLRAKSEEPAHLLSA